MVSNQTGWDPTITKLASYTASTGVTAAFREPTTVVITQPTPRKAGGEPSPTWFGTVGGFQPCGGPPTRPGWIRQLSGRCRLPSRKRLRYPAQVVCPFGGENVSITGRVYKMNTSGGGRNHCKRREEPAHRFGPGQSPITTLTGYTTDADLGSVSVNSGDSIAFCYERQWQLFWPTRPDGIRPSATVLRGPSWILTHNRHPN